MSESVGVGLFLSRLGVLWTAILLAFLYAGVSGQDPAGANITEADYYTMIPHMSANAPFGYRPGQATTSNSCQQVRAVPSELRSSRVMKPRGLGSFYQKYTEAYGIPVLASRNVRDEALRRACYTLRFLLAGHSRVRQSFYKLSGRVAVIGVNEGTTNIPEHSHLPNWWNQRARGLGATPHAPVSSGGEENVMCLRTDRYRAQDIFLHESVHGVHLLGAAYGIPGWDARLRSLYQRARSRGLWANTYSMSTPEEYFAEGTQSYYNVNSYAPQPDGVRGPINTRSKLRRYDPALFNMIQEVFPCDNEYLKRCNSTRTLENSQVLLMDCENGGGGSRRTTTSAPTPTTSVSPPGTRTTRAPTSPSPPGTSTTAAPECTDLSRHCRYWAGRGECGRNPDYMNTSCRQSCGQCSGGSCQDTGRHCTYWAGRGECNRNRSYMQVNCRASCQLC